MRSLAAVVLVQRSELEDDGLEVVRSWVDDEFMTGTLTPLALQQIARLGLSPNDATHDLILPNGARLDPIESRVVIDSRVYEVVRVTNLPHRVVATLRSTSSVVGP